MPPDKVRVLTGNVGGSFGMKAQVYPEYGPLLLAAKLLGRPVKWTDERSESFLSDHQGRDHQRIAELALDKDGRFLAVRLSGTGNAGAYIYPPMPATTNAVKNIIDVYATPAMEVNSKVVFTNTTPVGAYRGAGRPEGNYYMERLIDTAAREMGIDKVELRRRNHIAPEQMPYKAPSGMNYDSGEFTTVLDKALAAADWQGFDGRKAGEPRANKLRGRGIGSYLEVTGPPAKEYGGIRFEADGTITMLSGTLDYGQGHATPFAQVLGGKLGIPFERFRLLQGDSDQLKVGGGTGGSKSALVAQPGLPRGRRQADRAGPADRRPRARGRGGRHRVRPRPLHHRRHRPRHRHPRPGRASCAQASSCRPSCRSRSTSATSRTIRRSRFPTAATSPRSRSTATPAQIEVVRYFMVNDFGTVINPMLTAGQAHGGVMQGIGQALMERTVYDPQGQPVAGSYMDYALPRAVGRAGHVGAEPFGAVQDQPSGREGLRRGGLRRRAAVGDERRGRCAVGVRRHAHRHAGDAGEGVASAERHQVTHRGNDQAVANRMIGSHSVAGVIDRPSAAALAMSRPQGGDIASVEIDRVFAARHVRRCPAGRSRCKSRHEAAAHQQRIDIAFGGDPLDAVLGDELGDQLVVCLELGEVLPGEPVPSGADGIQYLVALAVARERGRVRRRNAGNNASCFGWLTRDRSSIRRRLWEMGTITTEIRGAAGIFWLRRSAAARGARRH